MMYKYILFYLYIITYKSARNDIIIAERPAETIGLRFFFFLLSVVKHALYGRGRMAKPEVKIKKKTKTVIRRFLLRVFHFFADTTI